MANRSGIGRKGEEVFNRKTEEGGCASCHGIKAGKFRGRLPWSWATPILDVGTDTRECGVLQREVDTGILDGAKLPFADRVKSTDKAFTVLATSVIGAIVQHALGYRSEAPTLGIESLDELPSEFDPLRKAFPVADDLTSMAAAADGGCAYEARVLVGIWATAPYLHNGSVMSLADLLKPASERTKSFKLGPNYDLEAVGLAAEQTAFDYTLHTTGCDKIDSGNSRCGHENGTGVVEGQTPLTPDERAALLEYLKTL